MFPHCINPVVVCVCVCFNANIKETDGKNVLEPGVGKDDSITVKGMGPGLFYLHSNPGS